MRLLAIAAHADDEALLCGGTLHKAARRGQETHVLLCTGNEEGRSCEESSAARRCRAGAEARRAAAYLGCQTSFLGEAFADMGLGDRQGALTLALIEAIRRLQPDIVITHAAQDWHCDHRALAAVVPEAAFQAGCRVAGARQPWRPLAVLHGEVDIEGLAALPFEAVSRLEVDDYEARRRAFEVYTTAPAEHQTNPNRMFESLRARAAARGALIAAPLGEAFSFNRQISLDGAALRLLAELLE